METAVQDPFVLRCDGSLTLANAIEQRERLLQALDRNPSMLIDVVDAKEMDVTFVQLLLSARKSAVASGKTLFVNAPAGGEAATSLARAAILDADIPPRREAPIASAAAPADIDPSAVATLTAEIGAAAVQQALGVFFTQMDARFEVLRGMSEETHLVEIRRETHPMKGAAGTFGLRGLSAEIADFEHKVGTLGRGAYEAALDRIGVALRRAQDVLRVALAETP